jgi:hypothetical protein
MSEAQLEKYLGEHAERLRKYQVAKVKGTDKPTEPPPPPPNGTEKPQTKWWTDPQDFRERYKP